MAERTVTVDLGDDLKMLVVAEQKGPELVSDETVVSRLSAVTESIERVGRETLEAAKRAKPSKATIELGFSLAIEQGQLLALFGKGRGEATINLTLEWSAAAGGSEGGN
jgi:hypothetical protein